MLICLHHYYYITTVEAICCDRDYTVSKAYYYVHSLVICGRTLVIPALD